MIPTLLTPQPHRAEARSGKSPRTRERVDEPLKFKVDGSSASTDDGTRRGQVLRSGSGPKARSSRNARRCDSSCRGDRRRSPFRRSRTAKRPRSGRCLKAPASRSTKHRPALQRRRRQGHRHRRHRRKAEAAQGLDGPPRRVRTGPRRARSRTGRASPSRRPRRASRPRVSRSSGSTASPTLSRSATSSARPRRRSKAPTGSTVTVNVAIGPATVAVPNVQRQDASSRPPRPCRRGPEGRRRVRAEGGKNRQVFFTNPAAGVEGAARQRRQPLRELEQALHTSGVGSSASIRDPWRASHGRT